VSPGATEPALALERNFSTNSICTRPGTPLYTELSTLRDWPNGDETDEPWKSDTA